MLIAGAALVMATSSLVSGMLGAKGAAAEADRKREAEMSSALAGYASAEDSINIMKGVNREQSFNAKIEVARAAGEQNRDVQKEIMKATSSVQAASEGLTSGRSKGREMINMQMKGSQALYQADQQAANMISQLSEQEDQKTNDLNNKLFSAYQDMASVLSTPGDIYQQNVGQLVSGTVSAAAQGASLGASLSSSFAAPTATKV